MAAKKSQGWVVWALDAQRFAMPVGAVERVLPALAVSPLPGAPQDVSGVVVVRGRPVPVVDVRRHFGLPPRETLLSDQFVLAGTPRGRFGFLVDSVEGVVGHSLAAAALDGVMVIDDLDALLGPAERALIDAALSLRAGVWETA